MYLHEFIIFTSGTEALPAIIGGDVGFVVFFVINMDRLWFHIALIVNGAFSFLSSIQAPAGDVLSRPHKIATRIILADIFTYILNIDTDISELRCSMVTAKPSELCIFQAVFCNVKYFCRKIKESEWFYWLTVVTWVCMETDYFECTVLSLCGQSV